MTPLALRTLMATAAALLIGLVAAPVVAADGVVAGAPAWVPAAWVEGATLSGQRVQRVETHQEFVRVHFAEGGFEVVRCRAADDPWCAAGMRIQPLPGADADEQALRARLDELAAVRPPAAALAAAPSRDSDAATAVSALSQMRGALPWEAVLALILALGCLACGWLAVGSDPGARVGMAVTTALALAAPLLGRTLLGESSVAATLVNRIHEASTLDTVTLIVAPYVFREPAWLLTDATRGAAGVFAANRLLWLVAVAATTTWLRRLLGAWPPTLLVAALIFTGGVTLPSLSAETQTTLAWVLICGGAAAFTVADDPARRPATRIAAVALIGALGAVVDRRRELMLLVAMAYVALAASAVLRSPRWRPPLLHAAKRAVGVAGRPGFLAVYAALALVHGATILDIKNAFASNLEAVAAAALLPTDVGFLLLPGDLLLTHGVLLAALVVLGAGVACVRERRWLWWVVAVASLYKVYRSLGHAYVFELQRYIATLAPLVAVIAALGWQELRRWMDRLAPSGPRRRVAWLLVTLTAVVDGAYANESDVFGRWPISATITADSQVEFRGLALAVARYPDCAIVTRSTVTVEAGFADQQQLVVFGANWRLPTTVDDEAALGPALAALQPAPTCALVFDGLACRAAGKAGCDHLAEGSPVDDFPTSEAAYRHPHFGVATPNGRGFTLRPLAAGFSGGLALHPPRPADGGQRDGLALPRPEQR